MNDFSNSTFLKQLLALRQRLLVIDPDIENDDRLWLDTLDGQTDAIEVLRRIGRHTLELERFADALKLYQGDLGAREAKLRQRMEACRQALRDAMEVLNVKSVPAPEFTAYIADGRPGVRVTDESLLPPRFIRTKTEPNISAISDALKGGQTVPGATLSNPAPVLVIRRLKS